MAALVEAAHAALRQGIRDGMFPAGHQASEQEIADRLGMSRTPVHEAIIRLQENGLVRVLSKRGIQICALELGDVREIYDVIIATEAMAAELLAALPLQIRSETCDLLLEANKEMDRSLASRDLKAWAAADDRFHLLLVERCGNRRLKRAYEIVSDQLHRVRRLTLALRSSLGHSSQDHRMLAIAFLEGDTAAARQRVLQHRRGARNEILPLLEKTGLTFF